MDGTFLNKKEEVSKKNQEAFWNAWNQGIHLAICSGRDPVNIMEIIQSYHLPPCYSLGLNGGHCLDKEGKLFSVDYFPKEVASKCIAIFEEEEVVISLMNDYRIALSQNPDNEKLSNGGDKGFDRASWKNVTWDKETFQKGIEEGICKLLYIDKTNPEKLEKVRKRIAQVEGVAIMSSGYDNIELMPVGVNKGIAVEKLAHLLNVKKENVMTLGDQENDVEMLSWAGYGIAMGNAAPKALAVAKYQTGHHEEDGVAQAINQYALTAEK